MRSPLSVFLLSALSLLPAAQASRVERGRSISVSARAQHAPQPVLGDLPGDLPERFEVRVKHGSEPVLLILERHALRRPGARVRVHGTKGALGAAFGERELPAVRTYRGHLAGDPASTVLASLGTEGLSAEVLSGSGEAWSIRPGVGPTHARGHVIAPSGLFGGGKPGLPEPCGVPDDSIPLPTVQSLLVEPLDPGCLKLCEIAYDADFEYFQGKGSSVPNVVAAIDAIMNQVDFFYARDLNVTFVITDYVVRTAPFYTPTSGGDLLNQFRDEWNGPLAGIQRDIAHLMTSKPGSLIEFGGLAYVGVTCNQSFGYGWSMDGANIVGHEVGHNFGSGHCHDVTPCNNMCGACFFIGPNTRRIKFNYMSSIACLDDVANYPTPLPPYATPDSAYLRKDESDEATLVFDVLENDSDGNCNLLYLATFDATSQKGGSIELIPSSPLLADRLRYTPPETPFVGLDSFNYGVSDGKHTTLGTVTVEIDALVMKATWKLDDGVGSSAADATANNLDGTLQGAPIWTSGNHDGALAFDGIDDSVAIPALGLNSNRATITAWVRRAANQTSFAGLVFSRAGNTVAGLHLGNANELRYTWNGAGSTFNWNSGLVLPNNQWAFVALVIEPDRARIVMNSVESTNFVSHGAEEFDGVTMLGLDDPGRYFDGDLDEVRIYDYALTSEELAFLSVLGGYAEAPFPPDGGILGDAAGSLRWVSGLESLSHDVYFGSDYSAVRDATPASPEYVGNLLTESFVPGGLAQDTMYFWRVDENTPLSQLEGRIWQFELARLNHWPLDEPSGSTANDVTGGVDGVYFGAPLLNQPGAKADTASAVYFDGINDRVQIPALDLDTDNATLTSWIRRDGDQLDWAGLIFSREQSTVAGLNFGTDNDLRYHWNGSSATWGWDSGLLVPDDTWVFVALAVEAHRATIYLGEGGVLTTATNTVSHPVEAFDGQTFIGRDPLNSARSFRGLVDDVRIYDAALSPAEILSIFLAP